MPTTSYLQSATATLTSDLAVEGTPKQSEIFLRWHDASGKPAAAAAPAAPPAAPAGAPPVTRSKTAPAPQTTASMDLLGLVVPPEAAKRLRPARVTLEPAGPQRARLERVGERLVRLARLQPH